MEEELREFLNSKNAMDYHFDNTLIFDQLNSPYISDKPMIINDKADINYYIGFPWCSKRCSYCIYTCGVNSNERVFDDYLSMLVKELKLFPYYSSLPVSSVYFGGGTPTLLPAKMLQRHLENILKNISLTNNPIITIETDVDNLVADKIDVFKEYVNRVSVGVQSFNTTIRRALNRKSSNETVQYNLSKVISQIPNVNVDLIYGLENSSLNDFLEDVEICVALGVSSVTLYKLEIVKGTPCYSRFQVSPGKFPTNYQCTEYYIAARKLLLEHGYLEQPVGWFVLKQNSAKSWKERIDKWSMDLNYLGFGVNAYTHLPNYYSKNFSSYEKWSNRINNGKLPIESFRHKNLFETNFAKETRILKSTKLLRNEYIENISHYEVKHMLLNLLNNYVRIGALKNTDIGYELTDNGTALTYWLISEISAILLDAIRGNNYACDRKLH